MSPLLKTAREYRDELKKAWKARRNLSETDVHDLRVASRRVGSALLLLESVLGLDRSSKARRRTKRLMKRLGPLRDVQVQILIVKKWRRTKDVQRFIDSLDRTESLERGRVRDYLSARRKDRILRGLRDFERDTARHLKQIPPATIQARIAKAISAQRMELKQARDHLVQSDPKSLHLLRTTSRRLRYCLEAASTTVGAVSKSELQRLRRRQTELGDKRDRQLLRAKYEEWMRNGG